MRLFKTYCIHLLKCTIVLFNLPQSCKSANTFGKSYTYTRNAWYSTMLTIEKLPVVTHLAEHYKILEKNSAYLKTHTRDHTTVE